MSEQSNEPTTYEILEAINRLSEHTDRQFAEMRQEFTKELASIKTNMITKEYLDEKLSDHLAMPEKLVRGTDDKVKIVAQKLTDKKVFTTADQQEILMMKPFAGTV
jgi:hypothetical protein